MAASIQINKLPDSVRAQYDSKDLNAVQMAREVPRQYQRNAEDGQVLKFPSTKNILWDHTNLGVAQTLHISYFRKPRLCISEKVLRFAQRHVESVNEKSASCVLVGTLNIDDDGEGVMFNVERLDPAGDPNSSTSHAAGDVLIPFTVQCGSKDRGSTSEDYMNALQLLKQRCCSKDPVELGNFLLTKGWTSFYTTGEICVHHLEFEVVTLGTEIQVTSIGPVPIVPTALSKNLSGPMSISHMQGTPKTGYLTMDHTRKLLLVLESDPKVINLPLVGIWVSGISYVYSPYIWACCLRYLHNATIQDRVCSPPDPFLLVLYNPTHSRPEFYECCTSTGTSKMTFDFYTGYEAVQISKSSMGTNETVEMEFNLVKEGTKYDLFETAVFASQSEQNESRRSMSPEPISNDDITPRLKPAPHQSRMPMVQSMVPEVSLFFGDEDTTYVPSVQHPTSRPAGVLRPQHQPTASGNTLQNFKGHASNSSVPNVSSNSAQNRPVPVSVNNYLSNAANPQQSASVKSPQQQYGLPSSTQLSSTSQDGHVQHHVMSTAPSSQPQGANGVPQHGFYGHQGGAAPVPGSVRPPYCNCPKCPRPPPPHFYRSQSYDPARHSLPQYPRHSYPNYGPPPPRLSGPQFNGYPAQHQPGIFPPHAQVVVSHSYPPPTTDYPHSSTNYPVVHAGAHMSPEMNAGTHSLQSTVGQDQGMTARIPSSAQGSVPFSSSNSAHAETQQQLVSQSKHRTTAPAPQPSQGLPSRAEERVAVSVKSHGQSTESLAISASGEARRSNPSSDNSGRSSDDSGLSFTPEKHHSPANPSPKASTQAVIGPAGDLKSSIPSVNWDSVPPEIYQLLMAQNQQLKQLQAQIEVLTAQSLNNTVESAVVTKPDLSPSAQKCTTATNTSVGLGGKEQVSACMQTSQQDLQAVEDPRATYPQQYAHRDMSSSSGSGCETRTPLEIRHRGRLPMNSTQREDGELDISQGELVALINNMHDKTIDSVQSEMIVDLPSFQSSPTRSPRSQESCNGSTAFNMSPRSPISASMYEAQQQQDSETEYTDDEEEEAENTAGTDPEYYNRLMDNIKKLLSQNTTGETEKEGYSGDISSDPSTPVKLARDEINLGEHLQSFMRCDQTSSKTPTDTTFIPKINYVSMLLDSDTDTSMEINAMAMKYLKDEQLTQLTKLQAKNRLLQGKNKTSEKTALLQKILKAEDESTPNVTTVGMSPNDLTFATKRYLERHGLLDGGSNGDSTSAGDSTQNDSYRLRTNYSTLTSGSEDGPAHITQEVLGTPSSRQVDTLNMATPSSGRQTDGLYSNRTTPGYDTSSTRTYNDSRRTYNDSRQSVGYQGTPKPNSLQSRVVDHHRFTPNGTNPHSAATTPQSQDVTPYSANPSPAVQKVHRDAGDPNMGMKGRYASPLITPAPKPEIHSPTDNQVQTDFQVRNREFANMPTNDFNRPSGAVRRQPDIPANNGVPNQFPARQHREEADDDRILDITRLKQLPKLL